MSRARARDERAHREFASSRHIASNDMVGRGDAHASANAFANATKRRVLVRRNDSNERARSRTARRDEDADGLTFRMIRAD
tara:strand:+ start:113 stop:355 length:243 start_codon:yes stop_codon:yes gene_type:complete